MTTIYKVIANIQEYQEGTGYCEPLTISYHKTEDGARRKVGQLLKDAIERMLATMDEFLQNGGRLEFFNSELMKLTGNRITINVSGHISKTGELDYTKYDVETIQLED